MDRKAPAYQWYPKDYDTDEAVKLMTYEQEGIYRRLLDHQALHGSIPAVPAQIAMLVPKVTLKRFLSLWPGIAGKFEHHNSRLINAKLERVKADTAAFKEGKSRGGKASAEARAATHGTARPQRAPNRSQNTTSNTTATEPLTAAEPATATATATASARSSRIDHPEERERARARGIGGGVGAGTFPRDHLHCHQPCARVCVSERQHGILRERHGGTDADLDAFYAEVRARLEPGLPIGDKPWQFWDAQFSAKFGSVGSVNPRTAGNAAAAARFIARGQK